MATKTRFVSVEVCIRTNSDCQEWIDWFEAKENYVTNTSTEDHTSYVCFAPFPSANADSTIRRLCKEIRQLPPEVRRHWSEADNREFFVGYHVGETPHCFIEHLQTDTLEMVREQDASIRIALYAAPDDD